MKWPEFILFYDFNKTTEKSHFHSPKLPFFVYICSPSRLSTPSEFVMRLCKLLLPYLDYRIYIIIVSIFTCLTCSASTLFWSLSIFYLRTHVNSLGWFSFLFSVYCNMSSYRSFFICTHTIISICPWKWPTAKWSDVKVSVFSSRK